MRPREIPETAGVIRYPPYGVQPASGTGLEEAIGDAAGNGTRRSGAKDAGVKAGAAEPTRERARPEPEAWPSLRPHWPRHDLAGDAPAADERSSGHGLLAGAGIAALVTLLVTGTWWLTSWLSGGAISGWAGRTLAVAGAAVLAPVVRSLWPRAATSGAARRPADRPSQPPTRDLLLKLAARLTEVSSLSEVLGAVTEEAARALRTPVGVFLADTESDELRLAAGHGLPGPAALEVWPPASLSGMSALFGSGRLAVVDDVRRGGMPGAEIHAAVGVRSVALAKMTRNGKPVGVLAALSMDERRAFSAEDLQILCGVADQTTQAVASAQLLDATERRLRMTQGLRNIDIAIAGSMDLRVTLNVILHETVRQLGVDAAAVLLLDRRTQTLGYAAGHGFHTRRIAESRLRVGEGHAGRVAMDRAMLRTSLTASPCRQRAELLEGEGFETYCGLPLIAKGEVRGVLEIFHRTRLEPDAEWSEFADALAGQAAIAIDSATLFADLQRVNANLVQAYDSTLEGWSRALDLRDRETEGHTQRVTDLAITLAREIGIHEDELVHLRRGAMLHDIGKMGIPDSILLKPGPLNEDEWRVMRQHPVLAYELLIPISYLRPAVDIPYCHHERWDGKGYPRGLRGEEIPLSARVFAVVDVWDALLSDRPYRKAWSASSARQYISSLSGAHFDPVIIDAFERVHRA
jgi:response regulator RpfG family c-di-GMP phosphodiesterase